MPELRQNLATKEWVIIATERAKRPEEFAKKKESLVTPTPHDANCPFCEGNESKAPDEILGYRSEGTKAGEKGWQLRVIPNKFPALIPSAVCPVCAQRSKSGIYLRMNGVGKHEVIIENPDHSKTVGTMSVAEVEKVIRAYHDRYLVLDWDPAYKLIIIFRNQGTLAGASLVHPHSQLVATAIVPSHIRNRIYEAQRYYDELGKCVFCDIIENEMDEKERIVLQNDKFIAFVPYAASVPYEIWILPKKHETSFADLQPNDIAPLAQTLQSVLAKLYYSLNNPDYNYCINTVPHYSSSEPYYHWHIQILPRLSTRAGFEIGSGININVALPEESAKFLREFEVK